MCVLNGEDSKDSYGNGRGVKRKASKHGGERSWCLVLGISIESRNLMTIMQVRGLRKCYKEETDIVVGIINGKVKQVRVSSTWLSRVEDSEYYLMS